MTPLPTSQFLTDSAAQIIKRTANRYLSNLALRFSLLVVLATTFAGSLSAWEEGKIVRLFDGKTFEGWEGDTKNTWRIEEDSVVGGSLEIEVPRNEFLCTKKRFENFELRLKYRLEGSEGFVNGGVQFRSDRVPNHHEVSGFQADIGMGFDGALYDESRRNKMLAKPSPEVLDESLKKGEWNDYRVRCQGNRIEIWLNDKKTIEYIEEDATIAKDGIIGLQIHGGCKGVIRFREIFIEELPPGETAKEIPVISPMARITDRLRNPPSLAPYLKGAFDLRTDETIVFAGGENMVIEQQCGWLERQLTLSFKAQYPRFRHMGYEGDTVFRQNRLMNWGSWEENLQAAGATVIVAWFGQTEVFDETKSIDEFRAAYSNLLDTFLKQTPRVVVLSPFPFQKPPQATIPDNRWRNERMQQLANAAKELCQEKGLIYIDLFAHFGKMDDSSVSCTRDGMHLTHDGMQQVSTIVASQLGLDTKLPLNLQAESGQTTGNDPLLSAIVEKNRIWFDNWRCMNWAFAYGDRTTQPFAQAVEGEAPFVAELTEYRELVAWGDSVIEAVLDGKPIPVSPAKVNSRSDPPAISADEEKSRFQLRNGFDINLFADESLGIKRPIQMRWDSRGRLWVLCVPSYPQLYPGARGDDFLIMLEDSDNDGRADKSTRILDGLLMPMGFEFGDDGIYLCESTQLVHWSDQNKDGKYETREVLLSGFGTGDSHQNINSIRWGADGCLWFSQGYHIWSYVETPHGPVELNRSGIWRFNPRTLRLDSFLNESTAGLNCWGVTFDNYGQVFHASGADISVWHTTPALIPTLHPLPLTNRLASSRGKSMEPEFLHSSHLPDEYQGVLLKSTYFTNQVQLYRLSEDGSSYKSEDLGDLISSTGTEFRPLETRVGPDGAIYICDWLNPVIGHYQASYRDPRRDLSHGRIWRMTAQGREPLKTSPPADLNNEQKIQALGSLDRWTHDHAKYSLYQGNKEEVMQSVDRWIEQHTSSKNTSKLSELEAKQLDSIWYGLSGVCLAHESPRQEVLNYFVMHGDYRWRSWGTRLVGYWWRQIDHPLELLAKLAADEHPRVRMEAAIAASYVEHPQAAVVATIVAEYSMDFAINYALTQAIHQLAPQWKSALLNGELDFGDRPEGLAILLTTLGDPSILVNVRQLLQGDRLSKESREKLQVVLIQFGDTNDALSAMKSDSQSAAIHQALRLAADKGKLKATDEIVNSLLTNRTELCQITACRVIGNTVESKAWNEFLKELVSTATNSDQVRAEAIWGLSRLDRDYFLKHADDWSMQNSSIQLATLDALTEVAPEIAAQRITEELTKSQSVEKVGVLLEMLLSRKGGDSLLAQQLEKQSITSENSKVALQWMGATGHDNAAITKKLREFAGIVAVRWDYAPELVSRLVKEANEKGNSQRGATLFRSAENSCLKCHTLGNEGNKLAPDLTAIGRAMTPEIIAESVFWPKRQVKEGYLLTTALTSEGDVIQGYRVTESDAELTLKDATSSKIVTIEKSEIEERKDTGTIMPEGLTDWMNEQDRLDLLRYLFELGR